MTPDPLEAAAAEIACVQANSVGALPQSVIAAILRKHLPAWREFPCEYGDYLYYSRGHVLGCWAFNEFAGPQPEKWIFGPIPADPQEPSDGK